MTPKTAFSFTTLAAGFKSTGDAGLSAAADRLLDAADGDLLRAHEAQFARYAQKNKLLVYLPLIEDRLQGMDLLWRYYAARSELDHVHRAALDGVYDVLAAAGIDTMAYKGTDMFHYYGNAMGRRFSYDVDPLVRHADLDRTDAALKAAGFILGHIDRTRLNADKTSLWVDTVPDADIAWVRANHHETHPYFKILEPETLLPYRDMARHEVLQAFCLVEDRPFALPNVDVHWSIGAGVDEADLWEGARRTVQLPSGLEIKAIPAEMNLCMQAGRAYSICMALGEDTGNYITDSFRIVLHPDPLDWDRVRALASKYRIEASLYHVLTWMNAFRPDSVPQAFLDDLEAFLLANREFDLGDFLPRVFGMMPGKRIDALSA